VVQTFAEYAFSRPLVYSGNPVAWRANWCALLRGASGPGMHHAASPRAPRPVFPEIDSLPRAECQPAADERNRERRRRDRRPDMTRHVVRSFRRVGEMRIPFRYVPLHPRLEITAS